MSQANTDRLESLIIYGYADTLLRVRRRVKGTSLAYYPYTHYISKQSDGIRPIELSVMAGHTRQATHQKLQRMIKAGLVRKLDKRYYLTDKGQALANAITEEFKPQLKEIIKLLVEMMRE